MAVKLIIAVSLRSMIPGALGCFCEPFTGWCCVGGGGPSLNRSQGALERAVAEYCPDPATDFQIEVEPLADGTVDWSSSGWTIHGQRRVSSKASFNLAGGYISWDMDLQGAQGHVNNNFYLTYNDRVNCGIDCYCDSGGTARGCAEMDLTENNGNCFQATTWHPNADGSDNSGEAQTGGLSPQTSFKAEWNADGSHLDVHVGGSTHGGDGLSGLMSQKGAVIYSSQWTGWVPGGDDRCGSRGELQQSSYTVKNLKIVGSVVTGPTPRLCHPVAPTPAPATPTPPPSPTPPSPGACTGGSLSTCMAQCPAGSFKACMADCQKNCGSHPPPPPPSPGACTGGSLSTCMAQCPAGSFKACMADCTKNCGSHSPPPPPPSPTGCTGGSLGTCMGQCPSDNYQACVTECEKDCGDHPPPAPPPPVCPGGSLTACMSQCSGDTFEACVKSCAKGCGDHPPPPPPPPPPAVVCPGGSLSTCMAQCPVDRFAACMGDCQKNCDTVQIV